jgi:hypothetical protein
MPAAAPIPRGPSVLTLYTAADLLTGPGCPVCRYAGEASDRYLAWFALEAHTQAATITRLCQSLGMCARHTRGLMSQPGAAPRLTAINRYVLRAARDQLTNRTASLAVCPACDHDDAAASRALDTLLDGLDGSSVRERYCEFGGLCIPHARRAAARTRRRLAAWLAEVLLGAVAAPPPPGPGWLAGTDHDADARAVLRKALPAHTPYGPYACVACLATARAEGGYLTRILHVSDQSQPDRGWLLCGAHLNDAALLAGRDGIQALLAWQTDCLAASVSRLPPLFPRWGGAPASWLRSARRRAHPTAECGVCLRREKAASRALNDICVLLCASRTSPDGPAPLCVRHLMALRALAPSAGRTVARGAVGRADQLIDELDEAFRKGTWAHRQEKRGREMTAWRRAAAFLDGGVFGGCPPRET